MAKDQNKPSKKKSLDQKQKDLKKLEDQLKKTFPDFTWEDRAMWVQSPQEFLFDQSPLSICATEDITPLLKWLKDREP